jgi:hypothetical protein
MVESHMVDALRKVEEELLPLYRTLPGFVAFTLAQTGEASATSSSLWQTREQAEKCRRTNENWMTLGAHREVESIHNHVGEVRFIAFTGDLKVYASPAAVGLR